MGIRTRHNISGAIEENTPEHIFNHPVFGKHLIAVDEDAKPFVAVLHRPSDRENKVETPLSDEKGIQLRDEARKSEKPDTYKKNGKD